MVRDFIHDSRRFEARQAVGEHIGRDLLAGREELTKAPSADEQIANDYQTPAVAQKIERLGDWAGGSGRSKCLDHTCDLQVTSYYVFVR